MVTTTVIPAYAGAMNFGVQGIRMTEIEVALIAASPGTVATGFYPAFRELAISGKTIRFATAPPTGHASVGDVVFRSNPSAGAVQGWVCTAGGSSPTWVPFGHVGDALRLGTEGGVTFYANATGAQPYFNLLTASGGIQFYQSAGITYFDANRKITRNKADAVQWHDFDPAGAGQKICNSATQKLGFWGKTPVVQPSGTAQAAVTLGNEDGEISGLTISATYDQAEVQALRDKCEELADDVRALSALIHALRTAAVNTGLIKGSA